MNAHRFAYNLFAAVPGGPGMYLLMTGDPGGALLVAMAMLLVWCGEE